MKELGSHVETHSPQVSMMMERILLGVLSLSGWIIPSICLHRQYHYVNDSKTWTEAASYCRRTYTDLASIENTEEMNQLNNTVSSSSNSSEVWIGLYSAIVWRWSDGYRGTGSRYRNWITSYNEPNFHSGREFCVATRGDGRWWDVSCKAEYPFICYRGEDLARHVLILKKFYFEFQYVTFPPLPPPTLTAGTQLDPEFVFVNESMSWSSAQRYCRENYTDLATVRNDTENQEIQSLGLSGDYAWIGLFRDPHLNWSDGSNYKFSYWDSGYNPLGSLTHVCAVAALQRSGKWRAVDCERRLPFVCYSIPANRQVVRLRMKPEDSSLDLNDPAVKADILKKLQDRLETKVAGATLKWREQPDGKVFFKEGKSSQKKERKKTESRGDRQGAFPFLEEDLPIRLLSPFQGGSRYFGLQSVLELGNTNGTQLDPEFVVVNIRMSWSSAQRYCRENFIDLATARNDTENQEIQSLVWSGLWAWIGLLRDPNLNWSDGSNYKFSYWDYGKNPLGSLTHVCAVAALQRSGKWKAFDCERRLPFVCYSIPANRQVVRLRMKPEDSSLDLNDPAVKADILKKLQDRLETKVAGATLKWREQPDGKVFFKEGKSSQKKERKKTEL
ncbi:C-type mannose receptor 2-like [Sebastes fasciatus]|uniref:C-type mannose receptor 2-like n=1 Tax=Sebastes fasciatus TaxID=394691 RepID=UPI003D9E874C